MSEPYVGYLKSSAALEVDQALRPHEGHDLMAVTVFGVDEGEVYEETFLRLRCADCDVDVLELDE